MGRNHIRLTKMARGSTRRQSSVGKQTMHMDEIIITNMSIQPAPQGPRKHPEFWALASKVEISNAILNDWLTSGHIQFNSAMRCCGYYIDIDTQACQSIRHLGDNNWRSPI
ncbi:MAG: hypothetical protein A3J49_18050 [Gallionellales bacterium RIFCSPHIGHO2_02_FULL_57_16]|nr:MAG: hypothetical protein A3J49_18050 [Gallionellales bacterium RIFCSPHIGHO2_02_FULL_57_16]